MILILLLMLIQTTAIAQSTPPQSSPASQGRRPKHKAGTAGLYPPLKSRADASPSKRLQFALRIGVVALAPSPVTQGRAGEGFAFDLDLALMLIQTTAIAQHPSSILPCFAREEAQAQSRQDRSLSAFREVARMQTHPYLLADLAFSCCWRTQRIRLRKVSVQ